MTNKKPFEIDKIRAFLKCHGCKIKSIKQCERDPPDAIAIIRLPNRQKWQLVGIEETEYYSATEPEHKSPEQALYDFWELTRTSLARRIAQRSSLSNIHGLVKLNKEALLAAAKRIKGPNKWEEVNRLARDIAEELVDLTLELLSVIGAKRIDIVCRIRRHPDQLLLPSSYTTLYQYTYKITLSQVNVVTLPRRRFNANVIAGYVGISPDKLSKIIKRKAAKLRKWHCKNTDERWLLITAPATTIFNSMHSQPGAVKWNDPKLINHCKSAGFDKIFFWSHKPPEWCKQLWPQ